MNQLVAPAGLQQDELVQRAMRWHFDPSTGSPFWLRRAASLPFSPVDDITCWDDLAQFPDVSSEWAQVPARDLIPQGCRDNSAPFETFDSGGTTGAPKRIVEATSRLEGVRWVSEVLAQHGVPGEEGGDWLHIGPTGPHIVGRSVRLLAAMRGSLCFFLDFDPRWVRALAKQGRSDEVARYVKHILAQAGDVLSSQPVSVLFATPPVLEALAADERLLDLVQQKVRGIIWAGTSVSPETLRALKQEVFPDAAVVGLYGNTMMGIAPQRPANGAGDDERCVFIPFHPFCRVRVVDPENTSTEVAYGERGQVKVSLVSRDLFLPWTLERDSVLRVAPTSKYPQDGLADIQPLTTAGAPPVVEGVY